MNIIIYNADNTELMRAPITAAAIHEEVLMDKDSITLEYNVAAASPTSILAGSYIEWEGIRYYMADDYRPESKEAGVFMYRPEFIHEVYMLRKMPFLLIDATNDGNSVESDWNYTGSLQDLANTLANAINDALYLPAEAQYTIDVDERIENALSLSFANVSILDALNSICEELECEWYTDEAINGSAGGKVIHIAPTCVHGTTLRLTAGVEVGLPSSNAKHEFFNRFYVFGSTRNIPQTYQGAQANAVVNKRLTLDPELHPDGSILLPRFDVNGNIMTELPPEELEDDMDVDDIFGSIPFYANEAGEVEHYIPDPSTKTRLFTKVLHLEDVYPSANLHVGAVYKKLDYVLENNKKVQIGTDANGDPIYSTYYVYYLTLLNEDNQPFVLDPSLYDATNNPQGNRIAGLDFSVHFKTGALTGREFVVDYNEEAIARKHADNSGTVRIAAHSFMINFTQDGTIVIPNSNIEPEVGDEVIVFNCRMPDEYVRSAYKKLEVEALKTIYEEWRDSNEYEVASNKIYFHAHPLSIHLGRHVKFAVWGRVIDTRVTKLTTNLDCSYEQKIAFSKGLRKGSISTLLTTIESTANRVTQVQQEDSTQLKLAKKQLYAAQQESIDAMFDPEGYFNEPIKPSTIQTQIIKTGAKSTNFTLSNVVIIPNIKNGAKDPNFVSVNSTNGKLTHYGISEEGIVEWNVRDSSATLSAGVYYIYARCTRTGSAMICDIVFDQQQRLFDSDTEYYYFLCGTLSSVQGSGSEAMRIVSLTYGSSVISGNNIQTGIIRSITGNTEINLDTGEIRGDFSFNATSLARVNEIIRTNATVAQASSDASDANATAQQASSDASDANANAQQALMAVNNVSIGGRNLVLNTRTPLTMTYPTSSYAQKWLNISKSIQIGSPREDFYLVASYKIDNWTQSFPPISTIVLGKSDGTSGNWGTDSWSRRLVFGNGTYKQLNATTRLYTTKQIIKTGDTNIGLVNSNTFGFLTSGETHPASAISFSVYEIMIERGSTPSDWSPAPEDMATQSSVNTAQTEAIKAQLIAKAAPNLWFDRYFQNSSYWSIGEAYSSTTYIPPTGGNIRLMQARDHRSNNYEIPLIKGHSYKISCWALRIAGALRLSLSLWFEGQSSGNAWNGVGGTVTVDATSGSWQHFSRIITPDEHVVDPKSGEVYLQIDQSASGGSTKWLVSDLVVLDYTANKSAQDLEYLKASLAEAASGTTDITGGLLLSNFIGVKENANSNFIVAGINGTTASGINALPMIFSGRTSSNSNGTFRVWNKGIVECTSEDDSLRVQLDKATLQFLVKNNNDYDIRNVITSALATSISSMLSAANLAGGSGTVAGISSDGVIRTKEKTVYYGVGGADGTYYVKIEPNGYDSIEDAEETVIVAANTFTNEAKISIPSFKISVTMYNDTEISPYQSERWYSVTKHGSFSGMLLVYMNGVVAKSFSVTQSATFTVPAQSVALAAKSALVMRIVLSGTFTDGEVQELAYDESWGEYMDANGDFNKQFTFKRSAKYQWSSDSFSWTAGQTEYCNKFYANALMLAESTNNYIGLFPKGDPMMQVMAKQYHGFKMTKANGLAFQQGSTYWWRLNPLALIVRLTFTSQGTTYNANPIYNPRNLAVSATRKSTGYVQVSLNIGHANYSVVGAGINDSNGVFVSSSSRTSSSFYVELVSGGTRHDWGADVLVFDFSKITS